MIVGLPGTVCSPGIFGPLSERLDEPLDAVSWMTQPAPWDIPTMASRIAGSLQAPVTLIGHSTGGAIALQLALEHPELVERLVLINTGPNMHEHGDVDAIIERLRTSWGPELLGAILDRSFAAPLPAGVRDEFLAYAEGVEPSAAIDVLTSQRQLDFAPRLGELAMPVTVIHGTEDRVRTVDQAERFAAAIPGARLHLLACGHSPMFELPDEVAALVR
jgi:pimeloyl-ACP methyl ester carboxylesterase